MVGNTFTWTGGSGSVNDPTNWGWISGPAGSVPGPPNSGDTVLVTSGTLNLPLDATLSANTLEIAGTGGTAAALVFQGDGLITPSNPSLDSTTLIESLVQGQAGPGATIVDSLGTFINQGTIAANGPAGSTFTIDVAQGTSGLPGAFINYGEIDVTAGNAMTIAVGTNAAFYNAAAIQVFGGSLDITTLGAGQFDGGYAPVHGVVVIGSRNGVGGTVEVNTGYTAGVTGSTPYFAFADGKNDLLKLDQATQFGGRIANFAAGDTIDIGAIAATGYSYSSAGILSLQNSGGTTVASLDLLLGNFTTGSFLIGPDGAGGTAITTTETNDVWQGGTGGAWSTGSLWSGGVPTSTSSVAFLGNGGGGGASTITTGGAPISVASMLFAGGSNLLQVGDSFAVGEVGQGGGTIEVLSGNTLAARAFSQISSGSVLQLDTTAVMTVAGQDTVGFPSNGTLSVVQGDSFAVLVTGSLEVSGGTLIAATASNAGGFIAIGANSGGLPSVASVAAGGTVTDTFSIIDAGPTGYGQLTISGPGATWSDIGAGDALNTRGYMLVGYNDVGGPLAASGTATLTVSNGATLTDASRAFVGYSAGSSGLATVGPNAVWNVGTAGGPLVVGYQGAGTLDIAGGTVQVGGVGTYVSGGNTFVSGGLGIGAQAGSSGEVSLNGGLLASGAGIGVGNSGSGTLDVLAGTVTVAGAGHGIGIGQSAGASGTLIVSGSQSLVTLDSTSTGIGVGKAGTGVLEVLNGGTVSVAAGGIGVGSTAGGSGTVLVSGSGSEIIVQPSGGGIAVGKAASGTMTIAASGLVTTAAGYGLFIGGTGAGPGGAGAAGLVTLQTGGTLDVGGNAFVWAGSTLGVDGSSGVDIGTSGRFVAGGVVVEAGHSLVGGGTIAAAQVVNDGTVVALDGSLVLGGSVGGTGALVLDPNSGLFVGGGLGAGQAINFIAGGAEALAFGNGLLLGSGGTIANAIAGFVAGDRIEFAGLGGNISASFTGTTLSVSGALNGTPTNIQLTNVNAAAAGVTLLTGNDPLTSFGYVELLGNNVWQWKNNVSAAATIAANWTLLSGGGNAAGFPLSSDTVIVPFGTVVAPTDASFTSNTIEVGGTTSVAAVVLPGDTLATWANPSVDFNSLIESNIGTQSTAAQTLLDITGRFVNEGTIAANGTSGSSFTIDVGQGTSGVAGAFINYREIDVGSGNAMTIVAGPTAAFFNAGEVQINHGYLDLTTSGAGAIAGGLAAADGIFVLTGGGTLEVNTGFPAGQTGSKPLIAFADNGGNLLKLDQPGQFGGRILGFGQGDTIDLGAVNIGTLVYGADGVLTLFATSGRAIASLVLTTGSFAAGSYAISTASTIVGGFTLTGNGGTDAQLTAAGMFDVWNGTTGTWTAGADWSGGVPGANDTALIAGNTSGNYVVSTGSTPLTVNGLIVADGHASLQIADAMTVTPAPVQGLGGTIELLGGGTLTASELNQSAANATLLLDQGATLDLLGHPNLGFADNGTLVAPSGGTIGLLAMGSVVVTGAVLKSGGFVAVGEDGGGTGASMLVQNGVGQGATVTDTYAYLSSDPTSFGSLTISGPNTTWTDAGDSADTTTRGYMLVGNNNSSPLVPYAGSAQLTVTDHATLTETSYANIANSIDSAGTAVVSGGGVWNIGTGLNQPGFLNVGRYGQGSLLITDNGVGGQGGTVAVGGGGTVVSQGVTTVVSYAVDIGQQAGAVGTLEVTGGGSGGSTFTAAGKVIIGDAGQGALDVLNGGVAQVTTASGIVVGAGAGGIGTVLVDGSQSLLQAQTGTLVVGSSGTGSLTVSNAGSVVVKAAKINGVASLDSSGSLQANNALTIAATGRIDGANRASVDLSAGGATVTDLGTIEATAGAFEVNGTLAGSGALQIDPGATLVVGGSIAGTDSFVFASGTQPATLDLATPGTGLANAVQNLQAGDEIVLENFSTITSANLINGNTIELTGSLAAGGTGTYDLTNVTFASGASQNFNILSATDPFTGVTRGAFDLACFTEGTPIATAEGETPVEHLRAGDLVRTASGALRPVRWIGFRRIDLTRHADPRCAQPIRVAADAIADGAPHRDIWLSPDHAILLRGGLIPIRLLVNGSTIARGTSAHAVTYYHVELDSHDILLAAGLAAESYLDTGNRGIFANADAALVLHPDFLGTDGQARREAESCAPFVADPARAEAAWWRVADRAVALGCPPPEPEFTEAPELALRIGDRRLRPVAIEGATYRFVLPAGVTACLISRSAYPSDVLPWVEDQRRLGVMVRRLTLWHDGSATPIALDDPALDRGWWAAETDGGSHWRWTDGEAALPVPEAAAVLEVELAATLPYPLPTHGRRTAATRAA
jgi:T5SS/PEP-CTERM-associated repeat protein